MKIRMRVLAIFLLSLANLEAHATCDGALPAQGVRDDILIVVNDNSLDSCEVGRYYAEKRGLGQDNIVHVNTPALYWLSWPEFRNLMDQLIVHLQQPSMLKNGAPDAPECTNGTSQHYCQESIDHLSQYSKARYLVLTRGVPTRSPIEGSGLYSPDESTSIDNYLSYWLMRYFPDSNNDGYSDDVTLDFKEREIAFKDGRGMREVDPEHDRELIVGRIDGLDLDSTKALIDRIIDSERNGIYGKHYGAKFGTNAQWRDYSISPNQQVYPGAETWHYQYAIFGEDRQECVDYLDFPVDTSNGIAPQHCAVKFSSSTPGVANSRTPIADDALTYLGQLQGQSSGNGNFNNILNWVRDTTCTVKLCEDAANPAACKAASTDALKEINTACVGVGDGFIGYNHQSFPVSYMTIWPTAWSAPNGGSTNNLSFPEVRDDIGQDDNFSIWFRNNDSIASPLCYATSDFSSPPTHPCVDKRRVGMYQYINFTAQPVNQTTPQQYQLNFWFKAANITEGDNVRVHFRVYESSEDNWVDYHPTTVGTFSTGDTDWTHAQFTLTLDPSKHTATDFLFSRIQLGIITGDYTGELAFDSFSLQEVGAGAELLSNTSFTEGHKQVSTGDHAAMYLSRLNGVGFWGSASHHQSGGNSFMTNPQETLIYFYRGLPLGDAVWWGENNNSGLFYGDPVYSPVAVRFDYINDYDFVAGLVPLSGSAVNGRNTSLVSTTYTIEYCPGDDFYVCDRNANWQPTGISGAGGNEDIAFGDWDASTLEGVYTLRLKVTSDNPSKGRSQSFFDHYTITVFDPSPIADADNDGLSNFDEIYTHGTDPNNPDTDDDTITDGEEINMYGTNPNNPDTDNDTLPDGVEINIFGTNPNNQDTDYDNIPDSIDNCMLSANASQVDTDADGHGNRCDADFDQTCSVDFSDMVLFRINFLGFDPEFDLDGDGTPVDYEDLAIFRDLFFKMPGPSAAGALCMDSDGDGIYDGFDNCSNVINPGQEDADADGHGNLCDGDFNNDCAVNFIDTVTLIAGLEGADPVLDLDSSGTVDSFDQTLFSALFGVLPGPSAAGAQCIDSDGDGIYDGFDNCSNVINPGQEDADADGHGNLCDGDFNNDCAVDFIDMVTLIAGLEGADPVLDLDSSGTVDPFDQQIFRTMFGITPGPSAAGALCP